MVKELYLFGLVEGEYLEFEFLEDNAALNDGLVILFQLFMLQFQKEKVIALSLVRLVSAGYFKLSNV